MATYLDRILEVHRDAAAADPRPLDALLRVAEMQPSPRGFQQAIQSDSAAGVAVIAEIKRRSPSKGALRVALDPITLARSYEEGGASCLSVLTERQFFGGSPNDLSAARDATTVPVLRKDFTVGAHDVCDARLMGADCVLLIAAALDTTAFCELHALASAIGLDVLCEIHDETELELVLNAGASLIGVNQRDLVTFEVDHDRAVRMSRLIPDGLVKVAESGVRDAKDVAVLRDAGYQAVLVGESLVMSADPASAIRALRGGP